jgi:hypothetical protein
LPNRIRVIGYQKFGLLVPIKTILWCQFKTTNVKTYDARVIEYLTILCKKIQANQNYVFKGNWGKLLVLQKSP